MYQPTGYAGGGHRSTRQKGIATILVVVLVGVAMTAASLGIVHSMKAAQEKQVAVHAVTHAQAGAWTGVEAFRRYLMTLDATGISNLANTNTMPIGLSAHYGSISAKNISVSDQGGGVYQVSAEIANTHSAAKSTAALGVVFEVNTGGGLANAQLSASLTFLDNLNVNGEIVFNTPAGTKADLNVKGNINITNITVSPLGDLTSTGTVTLNSGVTVDSIFANDNVSVTASAKVDLVRTKGNLTTEGGGYITTAWVDGNITSTMNGTNASGYTSEQWNSIGFVNVGSGNHKYIKTGGTLDIDYVNGMQTAQAVGNVTITNNGANIGDLITEGSINCTKGGPNFNTMSANGAVIGKCNAGVVANQNPPHDITVMQPNPTYSIDEFVVDVWALKSYSNYVFERESDGSLAVQVNNIQGAASGTTYYVGNFRDDGLGLYKKSILCTEKPDSNGNCTLDTITDLELCRGDGGTYFNDCLSYKTPNKGEPYWELLGEFTAPGVMWFKGNISIDIEVGYTTFLASGDIVTTGSPYLKAINFAGYGPVCNGQASDITDIAFKTLYATYFQDQYPTEYCDKTKPEYTPQSIGNMIFAAGGYDPSGNNTYSGGYIDLGSTTEVFGSVLAGSILKSFGGIKIHGYVTAAALNTADVSSIDNVLDGSTTIDLTSFPSTFDPTLVPDMSEACTQNCGGNDEDRSKVLWSRYL